MTELVSLEPNLCDPVEPSLGTNRVSLEPNLCSREVFLVGESVSLEPNPCSREASLVGEVPGSLSPKKRCIRSRMCLKLCFLLISFFRNGIAYSGT